MHPTIQRLQTELELIDDPQERLSWIAQLGKRLQVLPEQQRGDNLLVPGCVSRVWLQRNISADEKLELQAAADSPLVLGLVALLIRVAQNQNPEELPEELPTPLKQYGILTQLTPTRINGLTQVWKTIRFGSNS